MKTLAGADLRPLIDSIQSLIGWLAIVTSTPESRLSFTRQIAAEGTLQEQNEGLFAKVRKRRMMFDKAWGNCFELARRLERKYGEMVDDDAFVMRWEPVQARDTSDEREEWQVKRALGVPLETIWAEMGYDPEQIAAMKTSEEYRARMDVMRVGLDTSGG